MISNLKAKLDFISKDKPLPQENNGQVDDICSVYSNSFSHEDLLRDYVKADIGDAFITNAHKLFRKITDYEYCIEDIVFFDTETTGLSHGAGTIAFLVGLGYFKEGSFKVEQFLMNDYCQEKDMLQKLVDKLSIFKIAVSFNGKSFDVPIISSRSIINRIMQPIDRLTHWDLLYPSRRMYKHRLQSCSLKSIESNILGFEREGDIPGGEIPDIFFNYVKYKKHELMDIVIKHNMTDIISLYVLLLHLCNIFNNPERINEPHDMYSIATIYEQDGDFDRALECYLKSSIDIKEAFLRLAFISKRNHDSIKAIEYFNIYSSQNRFNYIPDIEISKIYEHQILDYTQALMYAEKAMHKLLGQSAFMMSRQELDSINNRIRRINDKIERKAGI